MPAVRWPDGRIDRARSFQMLLEKLNDLPWNKHLEEKAFRDELAARAYIWCGEPIVHPSSPPRRLFYELQDAGMLRIIQPGKWVK